MFIAIQHQIKKLIVGINLAELQILPDPQPAYNYTYYEDVKLFGSKSLLNIQLRSESLHFYLHFKITIKEVYYCESCGWPIDLCKYHTEKERKTFECEETLKQQNIELWKQIYNISDEKVAEFIQENNQIQNLEENQEDEIEEQNTSKYAVPENKIPMFGRPIPPSEKRKPTYIPMLQIRKASRGNNKFLTQVFNYEDFEQISDPKTLCHSLSKKFNGSCGIASNPDGTGEFISLQGDNVLEVYKYFISLKIPSKQIFIAKDEKHHGKKKVKVAQGAAGLSKKTMQKLGIQNSSGNGGKNAGGNKSGGLKKLGSAGGQK